MKNLIYSLAVVAIGLSACSSGGKSYKIVGTVEGASDGDTVFIQEIVDRTPMKTDTAIITGEEFVFTGNQDSTVNRYITYVKNDNQYMIDFFLENGNITAKLGPESSVKGTPTNDTYQAFKNKLNSLQEEQNRIYTEIQDSTITDKQRQQKMASIDTKDTEMIEVITQTINQNITNPIGVHLLDQYNFIIAYEDIEPMLEKVPAQYQNNEHIIQLREQINVAKSTAIGNKYVNFSMKTPEGKTVQLSDFISKNKYTLIDFWASWCGPCRAETPILVKVYAEYKDKGFGIVGVSLDKDLESWKKGIKALDITWPQMSDLEFWNNQGAKLYAVRGIPYTVLVDQNGIIVAKGLHGEDLQKKLTELFK